MMKKNQNILVVYAHFAAIALIALLTACSVDDSTAEEPAQQTGQETETVEYTVSIPATIGDTDGTRAVSLNGETGGLDATFQTADNIYAYNQSMQLMARKSGQSCVLHPDTEGPAADLTGKIAFYQSPTIPSTPRLNQWLLLMYKLNANANSDNPVFNYTGQKGTLEDVSRFDFATAEVKITGLSGNQGGYNVTTSNANFQNLQSMFRFNFSGLLEGDAIASVKIHSAKVKLVLNYRPINRSSYNGDMTVNLDDAARNANGTGVVYAALRFAELKKDETDDITFTVTSTNGITYTATKTTPKGGFQNGKFYRASIKLTAPNVVELDEVSSGYTAQDGNILTGKKTKGNVNIADGATVTLFNAEIREGLKCKGNSTIVLVGKNIMECRDGNPGIRNGSSGTTLTIKGTGSLTARGANKYPGIGGHPGDIIIEGGTIEARGGIFGPGIGGSEGHSCGNIIIKGGNIMAKGRDAAAGIGSGRKGKCRDIIIMGGQVYARGKSTGIGAGLGDSSGKGGCGRVIITTGVTYVYAEGVNEAIGEGANNSYCGDVFIGCTLDEDGEPVGGTEGHITNSPFIYPKGAEGGVDFGDDEEDDDEDDDE